MTSQRPKVSVALVTRNRPSQLARCLASLRSQSVQPYEIVVSDDSSSDFAQETLEVASRFNCVYITGPQRGLYANRNHSIRACSGSHVRTMDDDHEFPDEHFKVCENHILKDPAAIWFIGEYIEHVPDNPLPAPCPGQLSCTGYASPPPDPQHCWAISDGASIFPSQIIKSNPYCEAFPFGGVYLELGSRLYSKGFRMRHIDSTYIIHHANETIGSGHRFHADERLQIAAATYSLLCHSIKHQPSFRNYFFMSLKIAKFLAKGSNAAAGVATGAREFIVSGRRSNTSVDPPN